MHAELHRLRAVVIQLRKTSQLTKEVLLVTKRTIAIVVLLFLATIATPIAQSSAVVTATTPVFLDPTSTTPLATIPQNTSVRVLEGARDGWIRVEFRDQQFGNRTGYVKAESLSLSNASASQAPAQSPTLPVRTTLEPVAAAAVSPAPKAEMAATKPDLAPAPARVPPDARVFIEPTENGMHTALAGAFTKKKVPIRLVTRADAAEFIVRVTGEHKRAGWARTIMAGGYARGDASASMTVEHVASATVTFAYNVEKGGAWKGIQSAAEACAKHLNNHIEGKK